MSHEPSGTDLNRRTVLKASLLAGGGLALETFIALPARALGAAAAATGTAA